MVIPAPWCTPEAKQVQPRPMPSRLSTPGWRPGADRPALWWILDPLLADELDGPRSVDDEGTSRRGTELLAWNLRTR